MYFFTSTILNWKPILVQDSYKQIILESLRYLVIQKGIILYGFVIPPLLVFFTNKPKPYQSLFVISTVSDQSMYFFTATILNWKPILVQDSYKQIILESLRYLVTQERIILYGFVIMPNHIHLIWQMNTGQKRSDVQRDFLKFTGQQILKDLRTNKPDRYKSFEVNLKDRKHQIWQRNPLSIELYSREVIEQKLDYIHHNPVQGKWNLIDDFTEYTYSSASFYETNRNSFEFLSHYMAYFGY